MPRQAGEQVDGERRLTGLGRWTMLRPMQIEPILPSIEFGARMTGVDLGSMDDETFAEFEAAANRYAVLVVPDQIMDDSTQLAFSRRFGPLETGILEDSVAHGFPPEIAHLGNMDASGRCHAADSKKVVYDRGNRSWHSDSSFKAVPAKFSILSARILPGEGGGTEFADARDGYDSWTGGERGVDKEELVDEICAHSIIYSRSRNTGDIFDESEKATLPGSRQRLIRRHPATGRRNFYVGSHAAYIEGWEEQRSRDLLDELIDWCVRPERVYSHTWNEGDVVLWDNRRVMHRGKPWPEGDYIRVMHRSTVAGDAPSVDEPN